MPAGVILAGGHSTRFGETDKAVADLAGVPMVRRVADRLGRVVDRLVVNCRDEQVPSIRAALDGLAIPVAFAVDETPDRGPMVGLRRGLEAVDADYAAAVACDMPFVDPTFLVYCFGRAAGHDAAVPRPGGRFEPTQAVYHVEATRAACARAVERDERAATAPLTYLDYVAVEDDEIAAFAAPDTFTNLNTREALAAAAERIQSGERAGHTGADGEDSTSRI